jgi:predicted Zn-dependent protease
MSNRAVSIIAIVLIVALGAVSSAIADAGADAGVVSGAETATAVADEGAEFLVDEEDADGLGPIAKIATTLTPEKRGEAAREIRQGDFWLNAKNFAEAAKHFRKALEIDPANFPIRFRLAFCLHSSGDTKGALAEAEKVVETAPKFIAVYQLLCDIYIAQKDLAKAEEALKKAIAVAPRVPQTELRLAQVFRLRAEGQSGKEADELKAKATEILERLEKSVPPRTVVGLEVRRELARVRYGADGQSFFEASEMLAAGKPAEALKRLDEIVAKRKEFVDAHHLRGIALSSSKVGRVADAIEAFKLAVGKRESLLAVGQIYYERAEMEDAETWFKKAILLDGKYQEAHYALGLVYKELGEYEKAVRAWRQVVLTDARSKLGKWASPKVQVITGKLRALAEGEVVDPATERDLGQKFIETVSKEWGLVDDEVQQKRIERIVARLVAVSDRGAESLRWEVRIANKPAINAVCFPGGKILVFKGMLDFVKLELDDSDDALASVLGHEIAHATLRHGVNKAKVITARLSSEMSSPIMLNAFMNGFSRTNEFEADQYGALYAYRAGFDPVAAMRYHERMLVKKEIPNGLGHPPHAERITRLRDYLLELRGKTRSFKLGLAALEKGLDARAVHHFEMFLGVFPDSVAARNNLGLALHRKALIHVPQGHYKKSTDIDPTAKAPVIRFRAMKAKSAKGRGSALARIVIDRPLLREAIAELQIALKHDSGYVAAHVNLGAAILDLEPDSDLALTHLETALRLDPKNTHARCNLAVANLERGERDKGIRALKTLVGANAGFADAHFNLAVAYDRADEKADAIKAYERFLEIDSTSGWAKIAKKRVAELKE